MSAEGLEVLLSENEIRDRVDDMAERISSDYAGVDDLLLVGVLRGAFIFLADLARRLTVPHAIDFISLASYGEGDRPTGAVRLLLDLRSQIEGRHILIVEDIVDTGHTLEYLKQSLSARRPASLKTCALTQKPSRHEVPVEIDYLGFEIPDAWVVGYGLDFEDRFRTLPHIAVIDPKSV
jgi:hypoxanthine phosphoribosyltransferase